MAKSSKKAGFETQAQAVADAVRLAVMSMGLERIRAGEFFGMRQSK